MKNQMTIHHASGLAMLCASCSNSQTTRNSREATPNEYMKSVALRPIIGITTAPINPDTGRREGINIQKNTTNEVLMSFRREMLIETPTKHISTVKAKETMIPASRLLFAEYEILIIRPSSRLLMPIENTSPHGTALQLPVTVGFFGFQLNESEGKSFSFTLPTRSSSSEILTAYEDISLSTSDIAVHKHTWLGMCHQKHLWD